jgi:hypothetical protein
MVQSSTTKHNPGGLSSISEWFQLNTSPITKSEPAPASSGGSSSRHPPSSVGGGKLEIDGKPSFLDGRDQGDKEQSSVATSTGGRRHADDDTTIARTSTTEEPEELTHLDWRMNAKTSLSDWTIVVSTSSRQVKYYHVHRSIIMLPSKYFRKLFKRHRRAPEAGRSDFHLNEAAANAFPEFLDYVYHLSHPTSIITRENVVPLYYLSRIFIVDRFRWETRQFWETDMSVGTIAEYYRQAIVFEEEPLLNKVLNACLDDSAILGGLNIDAEILQVANPRLMLHLVKHAGKDKKKSEHLSRLVAKFCQLHPDNVVDIGTFAGLTMPLSAIAMDVACQLLIHEHKHFKETNSKHQESCLSSLQKCCIHALATHWAELDVDKVEFQKMLGSQSPLFLGELFQKTIMAVKGLLIEESADDEDVDNTVPASPLPVTERPSYEPAAGAPFVDDVFCAIKEESSKETVSSTVPPAVE